MVAHRSHTSRDRPRKRGCQFLKPPTIWVYSASRAEGFPIPGSPRRIRTGLSAIASNGNADEPLTCGASILDRRGIHYQKDRVPLVEAPKSAWREERGHR